MLKIYYIIDWDGTIIESEDYKSTFDCFLKTMFQPFKDKNFVFQIIKREDSSILTARSILSMLFIRLRLIKDFWKKLTFTEIKNILLSRKKVDTPNRAFFYNLNYKNEHEFSITTDSKLNYIKAQMLFDNEWKYNIVYIDSKEIEEIDY